MKFCAYKNPTMKKPPSSPSADVSRTGESATEKLDRLLHAAGAPFTGGLSPVSLSLALADWAWHLGISPGRQMELAALAVRLAKDTMNMRDGIEDGEGAADDDPRFRHEAWAAWPFSQLRTGFRNAEAFWREAAHVPGMTAHHDALTQFFAKQIGQLFKRRALHGFARRTIWRGEIDNGGLVRQSVKQ